MFLLGGQWLALVLNLPLVAWNAKKYASLLYLYTNQDLTLTEFTTTSIS